LERDELERLAGRPLRLSFDDIVNHPRLPEARRDGVRLLSLPTPRDADYFEAHRSVSKALVQAFRLAPLARKLSRSSSFVFGWAALPARFDMLPRAVGSAPEGPPSRPTYALLDGFANSGRVARRASRTRIGWPCRLCGKRSQPPITRCNHSGKAGEPVQLFHEMVPDGKAPKDVLLPGLGNTIEVGTSAFLPCVLKLGERR
jgi:hypothetical protein